MESMAVLAHRPNLELAAAQWQWALDAAAKALDADGVVLPPAEIAQERRHLARERHEAAALLQDVAALSGTKPAPWLAFTQMTLRMLGLPQGTEACLFDLDGVLTDSDALHAAAWAQTLDETLLSLAHGEHHAFVPFDSERDYHAYFDGRPRVEGILLFFAGRGLELPQREVEAIARRKGELLARGLGKRGIAARDHAHRYLQAAGLARLQRAAVSASSTAGSMLAIAGLTGVVDAEIDDRAMRAQRLKARPAPDLLLAACEELAVEPARAVSLTHSGAGVVAAGAIGMSVIGVATGAEAEALRGFGAPVVVPSLGALLDPALRAL
jgi:beta-phosphoglucomutase-like phosphatase (HAD superfamily)